MPAQRKSTRSSKKGKAAAVANEAIVVDDAPAAEEQTTSSRPSAITDITEAVPQLAQDVGNVAPESGDAQDASMEDDATPGENEATAAAVKANGDGDEPMEEKEEESTHAPEDKKMTMEERKEKLRQLREKMHSGALANRASVVAEHAASKVTAREAARLEKQRKLAETLRTKADAEERGEDVERTKNWEWTIEENDKWEEKLKRKKRRADFEFHDDAHAARRRYKKDLDLIKPDLTAYNKQKELALGLAPGALASGSASSALTQFDASGSSLMPTQEQQLAAESLYRDANTLIYGDNKPSEEAIDRVVGKINNDLDKKGKFSRRRLNETEGDITYINERNRVFNKKIARYYDKYTAEIRASFERGTAL